MQPILSATGLRYLDFLRFPPISVERGSAAFICGQSGAGKTTLLRLFNRTLTPAAGTILYDGADIAGIDPVVLRRQVLLAGQKPYLFDDTIRGNFAQFAAYRGEPAIGDEAMFAFLALCSLEMPLTARCQELSGGERQRVFLAIHLSMRPRVLMLDEPTSALDGKTARQMLARVKAHCKEQGITLLAVSHDAELTKTFADQVIALSGEACE